MWPVTDPTFWRDRLAAAEARGERHRAVFECSVGQWEPIVERHRRALRAIVQPHHNILDVGCGYGRLLDILPGDWRGEYLGVDISEDFVALARELHANRNFVIASGNDVTAIAGQWDLAVFLSVRKMLWDNDRRALWIDIFRAVTSVAKDYMILEYVDA